MILYDKDVNVYSLSVAYHIYSVFWSSLHVAIGLQIIIIIIIMTKDYSNTKPLYRINIG